MYQVILVLHIVVTLMLIAIILMQRSDSDGFGLGGGGNNLMTGRASANLLTRTTAILATVFILTSLGLSLTGERHKAPADIADQISDMAPAPATIEPTPVPQAPQAPKPE